MPEDERLDEIAIKLTGHPFNAQPGPAEKAMILDLAIKADSSCDLRDISIELGKISQHFNALGVVMERVLSQLEELDKTLVPVMEWFEKSKLWEGEAWVRK
jgi:hypothetical protein